MFYIKNYLRFNSVILISGTSCWSWACSLHCLWGWQRQAMCNPWCYWPKQG